ncbi:AAA family ATPase [Flavihumibacter sp. R14]|nr:AAA family ATPase [Flavihumibacter soli]
MPASYFLNLLSLLQIEREADLRSYKQLSQSASVADRRAAGLTWYPIAIRNTELTRGDYLSVEAERTTHQDLNHQLRFGAAAVLFSNHDPHNDRLEGTISFQNGNRCKINLRVDELPDWASNGKLGIELLFDDKSYEEMKGALKEEAKLITDNKDGHLARVLTGQVKPTFKTETPFFTARGLNQYQEESVSRIMSATDLAIVHGPPGTGKTTTLVQAIKALIRQDGKQVLVVAPSNTAVDLLTEKLADEGLHVLRVGNPARVSEKLLSLTLDSKTAAHASMKEVRTLKKQANEYRNMAHKYKRNFGRAEREQRKALFDEAHKIIREVGKTEEYIQQDLIASAQVIAATLVGANHYTVSGLRYDTVVIDEAGQALEPACWIPILKAKKVILAGDPFQLPPTIKSDEAARKGLNLTLLEKCIQLHPEAVVLLEEQYRMNSPIMTYSSGVFYHGRLKAHHSVADRKLFPADQPLNFIDTAGCGFDEKTEGTSTTNTEEAQTLINYLIRVLINPDLKEIPSVAIISPYKEQIHVMNELLGHSEELKPFRHMISVNTIDSFQGQERDVVCISMTRSNSEGSIGFLADIRRMNVAMTRARKKLVVIGDSATLSRHSFYAGFIEYAEKAGGYLSAWELM